MPVLLAFASLVFLTSSALALNPEITISDDESTVIVNDAPEQELYVIGKSVVVNKRAKGVLAIGGDVVIEGRVEGDVAAVGGNVVQKEKAYVGGDIIVFGGAYKPEAAEPLREPGKETVTFGVFEEELRDLGKNPSQILSPTLSLSFVAQRVILALFWFVMSLVIATLAPGAVSRAVARINLSLLKVCAVGGTALVLLMALMIGGALVLPDYLSATVGLMGILVLVLGYVFGRVALQVSIGKLFQKYFLGEASRSETLATLIGVVVWTLLLSLPYLWLIALFAIFVTGIGLVLTGRVSTRWQNP